MIEDRRLSSTVMVAAIVVALAALWSASESHYRSCVLTAQARYPAVSVSALTTRDTGPLKLSFVSERQKAVKDCNHLPLI